MSDHLTLEEFNRSVLVDATRRFAASAISEELSRGNALADMLYMSCKPPTRWQRWKNRAENLRHRASDIWTIATGGDIHENCGY
jgi:hypothetical protein